MQKKKVLQISPAFCANIAVPFRETEGWRDTGLEVTRRKRFHDVELHAVVVVVHHLPVIIL